MRRVTKKTEQYNQDDIIQKRRKLSSESFNSSHNFNAECLSSSDSYSNIKGHFNNMNLHDSGLYDQQSSSQQLQPEPPQYVPIPQQITMESTFNNKMLQAILQNKDKLTQLEDFTGQKDQQTLYQNMRNTSQFNSNQKKHSSEHESTRNSSKESTNNNNNQNVASANHESLTENLQNQNSTQDYSKYFPYCMSQMYGIPINFELAKQGLVNKNESQEQQQQQNSDNLQQPQFPFNLNNFNPFFVQNPIKSEANFMGNQEFQKQNHLLPQQTPSKPQNSFPPSFMQNLTQKCFIDMQSEIDKYDSIKGKYTQSNVKSENSDDIEQISDQEKEQKKFQQQKQEQQQIEKIQEEFYQKNYHLLNNSQNKSQFMNQYNIFSGQGGASSNSMFLDPNNFSNLFQNNSNVSGGGVGGSGNNAGGGNLSNSSGASLSKFSMNMSQEMVGSLTKEERKEKVERYLRKKETRKWKNIRYKVRQNLADNRQRSQGRFVKSNNPRFNINIYDKNVIKSINKQIQQSANNIAENNSCPPEMFNNMKKQSM